MTTDTLKRRARRCGFDLLELPRIDGCRFLVVEKNTGVVVRGTEHKPLAAEDVARFLERFDAPDWLP